LDAAHALLADELSRHPQLVVLGDFNIAPTDGDIHDPKRWREKIMCSTPEREALARIQALGLHDSFRMHNEGPGHHSWWEYRLQASAGGGGLPIGLLLASDALRARCVDGGIDLEPRRWERPSGHAPVWPTLGRSRLPPLQQKKPGSWPGPSLPCGSQ